VDNYQEWPSSSFRSYVERKTNHLLVTDIFRDMEMYNSIMFLDDEIEFINDMDDALYLRK